MAIRNPAAFAPKRGEPGDNPVFGSLDNRGTGIGSAVQIKSRETKLIIRLP
jgi:hypothetical protein